MTQKEARELQIAQDREIYDKLCTIPYPAEQIAVGFNDWLRAALQYENEQSLGCSFDDFKTLVAENPKRFSTQLMGYAINAIAYRKPFEITDTTENYIAIRERLNGMVANWDRIVQPVRGEIIKRYQAKMALSMGNKILS